jgi:hypothetical protein
MYQVNKSLLRNKITESWLVEHGASTADLELSTKLSRRILDLDDNNDRLDTTYTVRLNVFAEPRCRIAMHTQVLDTRKYGGTGNAHLYSTFVERVEQEALSSFRVGLALSFIKFNNDKTGNQSNKRFYRTCPYCEFMHGCLHIDDVFHVLFVCPIAIYYLPLLERAKCTICLFLNSSCGADTW